MLKWTLGLKRLAYSRIDLSLCCSVSLHLKGTWETQNHQTFCVSLVLVSFTLMYRAACMFNLFIEPLHDNSIVPSSCRNGQPIPKSPGLHGELRSPSHRMETVAPSGIVTGSTGSPLVLPGPIFCLLGLLLDIILLDIISETLHNHHI